MVTVVKHLRHCAGLLRLAVLQFLKDVPLQRGGGGGGGVWVTIQGQGAHHRLVDRKLLTFKWSCFSESIMPLSPAGENLAPSLTAQMVGTHAWGR